MLVCRFVDLKDVGSRNAHRIFEGLEVSILTEFCIEHSLMTCDIIGNSQLI